jgi:uncharacterized repeat protein (TIGR02543 family)
LATLLFVVPAGAVTVTCVNEGGNVVRIDYNASDEQVLPVAFALDLTVDNGATITSVYDYKVGDSTAASRGFGIFPSSMIVDEKGLVSNWGKPDMNPAGAAGVQPGVGTSAVTIGMASRYSGRENAPSVSGTLCRIRVDPRGAAVVNVKVAQNAFGGGVVLENATPAQFTGVGCILGSASSPSLPQPPASITYPASSSTGKYPVSWPASTGATSYELERSANGGSTWAGIYSGAALSYAETVPNGTYRYRVRATNSAGSSFWRTSATNCVVSIPSPPPAGTTVGTTTVLAQVTTAANRRAAPYTMPEAGQLQSVSIYHQGGSGQMILAVYGDSSGRPGTRLGVTGATTVNSSQGWQTVALQNPVSVTASQRIWLAWVFQTNPGIRFATGTPGRAESSATWSDGMPATFGSSNVANYIYSIYATYSSAPVPPATYTLTTSAVNGTVTRTPNKTSYTAGETVTLQAVPNSGYTFSGWSGALTGTTNPATLVMDANKSVTANFTATGGAAGGTIGTTTVLSGITTVANRRAAPYTASQAGQLQSVSIYHQGGSGRMILAVYGDSSGRPGTRLGVTNAVTINSSQGWQTVALQTPVSVSAGQRVWLAWVFERNPGIRFAAGTPGRAESSATWSGGMPSTFGSSTVANYIYSIYATYGTGSSYDDDDDDDDYDDDD